MARATNIYVVIKEEKPIATFTVKHECIKWLNRIILVTASIWVFKDNALIPEITKYTLEEFMK